MLQPRPGYRRVLQTEALQLFEPRQMHQAGVTDPRVHETELLQMGQRAQCFETAVTDGSVRQPKLMKSHQAANVFQDRKSTRLNSSHTVISYAVFCLKKKNQ